MVGEQTIHPGTLYVVATPIGNLDDMGIRAQQVLARVALILAEDTRTTRRLLAHHGISSPRLLSLHEHNERSRCDKALRALRAGTDAALVSDAGTPLISDPGFVLVRAAHEAGLTVSAVPGPCALAAALSVAGLPVDRFCFEGFLPARAAARRARLDSLAGETRTLVFFETPRRLPAFLKDAAASFGAARPAALVRELSKRWEQVRRDTLGALQAWAAAEPVRGECTILIAGAPATPPIEEHLARRLLAVLTTDLQLPHAHAVRVAAAATGLPRNRLYRLDPGDA